MIDSSEPKREDGGVTGDSNGDSGVANGGTAMMSLSSEEGTGGRIVFPASGRGVDDSLYRRDHPLFPEPRQRHQQRYPTGMDRSDLSGGDQQLMGPILRRKKVVSMPLGAGGDFFVSDDVGGPHRQLEIEYNARHRRPYDGTGQRERQLSHEGVVRTAGTAAAASSAVAPAVHRQRQVTPTSLQTSQSQPYYSTPPGTPGGRASGGTGRRKKQGSFMDALVRRKQISLDLLGPNDFFGVPGEEEVVGKLDEAEEDDALLAPEELIAAVPEDEEVGPEELAIGAMKPTIEEEVVEARPKKKEKKLFLPLRFSPPVVHGHKKRGGGGHGAAAAGGHGHPPTPPGESGHGPSMFVTTVPLGPIDEETSEALARQSMRSDSLKLQLSSLRNKIEEEEVDEEKKRLLLSVSDQILETQQAMEAEQRLLQRKLEKSRAEPAGEVFEEEKEEDEAAVSGAGDETGAEEDVGKTGMPAEYQIVEADGIVRATKADKIKAGSKYS